MAMQGNGQLENSVVEVQANKKVATKHAVQAVVALVVLTASSPAFCQLTNMTTKVTSLVAWLASLSIAIFTGVFLYVGYKMLFDGAQFRDMVNILIGGFFVGGAAGLAAFVAA